jgi:hypothetical protein
MWFKSKKKKIEPICGNCRLFNEKTKRCSVVVLLEGQKINIPVDAEDKCFFETEFVAKGDDVFKVEVNEIKMWTEDPKTGEKSDKGIVKIEYPEELDIQTFKDDDFNLN